MIDGRMHSEDLIGVESTVKGKRANEKWEPERKGEWNDGERGGIGEERDRGREGRREREEGGWGGGEDFKIAWGFVG